jgi:ATP-dependent Lon protease
MAPRKVVTPDVLGILPLQDAVLFPNTVIPLAVIKRPGIALVEEALREGKQIGLVVLKDKDIEDPGPDDLRRIGTIGTIQKMLKVPDGTLRCIVAGGPVFQIDQIVGTEPYLSATYKELPEVTIENDNLVAMQRNLSTLFQKLLGYLPQAPREMEMEVNNISDPNLLTYFVASTMRLDTADRQAILEERNTEKRLRKISARWKRISATSTCVSNCARFRKNSARPIRSKPRRTNFARRSTKPACPKTSRSRPIANSTAWRKFRRPRPSTA